MSGAIANDTRMLITTSGAVTTVSLGAAAGSYQTFAAAGVVNGQRCRFSVVDGANFMTGLGTYLSSGPQFTFDLITDGSSGPGTPITLSGTAQIGITAAQEDFSSRDTSLSLRRSMR